MNQKKYTLRSLAEFLGAEFRGDPDCLVTGIGSIQHAKFGDLTFVTEPRYERYLSTTQASVVMIAAPRYAQQVGNYLLVAEPYVAYAKLSKLFEDRAPGAPGIHPSAIIGEGTLIGANVSIGPYCVLGRGVVIGDDVQIAAGCVLEDYVVVGAATELRPRVVLYHKVKIGKGCIVHSGAVIGSDGFGNANEHGVWQKIYQLGSVVIGDNVEVGANTTIDRGALDDTVLEVGVKLDNLIQLGHNVQIGAHTAIAGCVGIAGSTKVGKHCMIGGGVGIAGHLTIADGVIIGGKSAVGKSLTEAGMYSSAIPAMPYSKWARVLVRLVKLEELARRVIAGGK